MTPGEPQRQEISSLIRTGRGRDCRERRRSRDGPDDWVSPGCVSCHSAPIGRRGISDVTRVVAALVVAGVTALAVTAMLLVRRRAPAGSDFEDGDRAAGVFGVLATGFAVLLGFVVFLAFESFDTSRSGAETEAQIVREQFETVQLFPKVVRARLSAELVCYARAVVHDEWPKMQAGTL